MFHLYLFQVIRLIALIFHFISEETNEVQKQTQLQPLQIHITNIKHQQQQQQPVTGNLWLLQLGQINIGFNN